MEAVFKRLFVEVEACERHVHLTREQVKALFGHELTGERPLSQPGQYLARERVEILGPGGALRKVAVVGPVRKEAQVEISLTDGQVLGLVPPVKPSGEVSGSPGAVLVGPRGRVELRQGVIGAQRHIHMTPEAAESMGVRDGEMVKLQVFSRRPVIFEEVLVRVSPDHATCAHLNQDEANACGWEPGDWGRIIK